MKVLVHYYGIRYTVHAPYTHSELLSQPGQGSGVAKQLGVHASMFGPFTRAVAVEIVGNDTEHCSASQTSTDDMIYD
jgi:hypothetical protein